MECFTFLLAIGVLWLIVRDVQARDRLRSLELRLDELSRELWRSRPAAEALAPAPPPTPPPQTVVAAPEPLPPPPRPVPPPIPPKPIPVPAAPAPLPPPVLPPLPPPAPAVRPAPVFSADWESLIGVRLFSWMAGIMLAIAGVLFLRYSIQHGWLSAPVRMAIGILTGAGLLVLCEWRVARRYTVTANALDAAGIAILFSTIFASHVLWQLLGAPPAFLLMALVATVAVGLAIRRESPFIAVLGLLGGFATPALLSTGEDRPFALFGYLLLLNAGLAWVALKRGWTVLIRLALAFTFLYQWGWVFRFLEPERILLALGVFLIFPALFLLAPALARRPVEEAEPFWQAAAVSAGLPFLLAVYLAAAPGFGEHWGLLFGYLLLLGAGLAVFAAVRGPALLHALAGTATVAVYGLWLVTSYTSEAWPELLAFLSAEVLLYLAAPWVSRRVGGVLPAGMGTFAAPLLLATFPALLLLEPATAAPGLVFGVLFLLMVASAASALVYESGWIHFGAAFFALAAEALWSGSYLTPERLLPGLALYAVFGLFYLGVALVGSAWTAVRKEEESPVFQGLYLALIGHLFLLFVASEPKLSLPPWPVLGVLAVLTLAAGVAALALRRGDLHAASLVGSQLVLAVWAGLSGRQAPWPSVAVVAAAVLAALGLGWVPLARRREREDGALVRACVNGAASGLFAAQGVGMLASGAPGVPPLGLVLGTQAAFAAGLLFVAWRFGRPGLAPLSVVTSFLAAAVWHGGGWGRPLFAAVLLLIHLAYPLALGERARTLRQPWQAAVLASTAFFFLALGDLRRLGLVDVVGLLPVLLAAALAVLLRRLLALEPAGGRDQGRLALVAGAVLAFVTVAIPLQLEKQWITIGWALLAAALAWLYGRIPHRGLLGWTAALGAAVFVRLSLNPAVLIYHPRADLPIWNWYLYTYLVSAAALLAAGRLLGRTDDRLAAPVPRLSVLANAGAGVLLFLLLNIEIADFFSTGPTLTFGFLSGRGTLAEGLTYTLGWAIFALALLVTGIVARSRAARIAAIGLLLATVLKGFLLDLASLGGLYRVASFVGMAVCLAAVAILIQRFVLDREPQPQEGNG